MLPRVQVFLTRHDMEIFHEPLGDPYYHGKEILGTRFKETECERTEVNPDYKDLTYGKIFDELEKATAEVGLFRSWDPCDIFF